MMDRCKAYEDDTRKQQCIDGARDAHLLVQTANPTAEYQAAWNTTWQYVQPNIVDSHVGTSASWQRAASEVVDSAWTEPLFVARPCETKMCYLW